MYGEEVQEKRREKMLRKVESGRRGKTVSREGQMKGVRKER